MRSQQRRQHAFCRPAEVRACVYIYIYTYIHTYIGVRADVEAKMITLLVYSLGLGLRITARSQLFHWTSLQTYMYTYACRTYIRCDMHIMSDVLHRHSQTGSPNDDANCTVASSATNYGLLCHPVEALLWKAPPRQKLNAEPCKG